MRRIVAFAVMLAALAAAAPVAAHVTVSPPFLTQGAKTTLNLDVPNERQVAMTGFTLILPKHVEGVEGNEARVRGWGYRWIGRESPPRVISWDEGRLPVGRSMTFSVRVQTNASPGTVTFTAVQRYADGGRVRWQVPTTVVPGTTPSEHLGRALAAGIAGLVVVVASIGALHRMRRRSLQKT
jgi:hypothetical protein